MNMKTTLKYALLGASLLFASLISHAQCDLDAQPNNTLIVDNGMPITEMAQQLVGDGVEIFNVSVNAHPLSYGYYCLKDDSLGQSQGILLTTGHAENAIGPNDETGLPIIDGDGNCVNCSEYDNFYPGSPLQSMEMVTASIVASMTTSLPGVRC